MDNIRSGHPHTECRKYTGCRPQPKILLLWALVSQCVWEHRFAAGFFNWTFQEAQWIMVKDVHMHSCKIQMTQLQFTWSDRHSSTGSWRICTWIAIFPRKLFSVMRFRFSSEWVCKEAELYMSHLGHGSLCCWRKTNLFPTKYLYGVLLGVVES